MSLRIGMRELREKLAEYLESSMPIEITRHGQTIGFYIPVPKRPSQSERDALLEAGRRMQEELARLGITEEELAGDFKAWRRAEEAAMKEAAIFEAKSPRKRRDAA
jgi:antitoxin (DNA-binding transcriptional repressor) of toxin-antitoxin stability system